MKYRVCARGLDLIEATRYQKQYLDWAAQRAKSRYAYGSDSLPRMGGKSGRTDLTKKGTADAMALMKKTRGYRLMGTPHNYRSESVNAMTSHSRKVVHHV